MRTKKHRRGTLIVLAAVLMVPLMGLMALAVDLGYIFLVRTKLQATADASVSAAVVELPSEAQVIAAAQEFAQLNYPEGGPILQDSHVEIGFWNDVDKTFTPTAIPENGNAVRVTVERNEENGNPLELFFAPFIGVDTVNLVASATALVKFAGPCGPIIGIEEVEMQGNGSTDSYNSSHGAYDPTTAGMNAGICSNGEIELEGNATVNGNVDTSNELGPSSGYGIEMQGNATVNGNAFFGDGFDIRVQGNASVTGLFGPDGTGVDLEDYQAAIYAPPLSNDNHLIPLSNEGTNAYQSGDFRLSGNDSITIPSGEYHFDDFEIQGNAVVTVTGPATFHIDDDFDVQGNATLILTDTTEIYIDDDFDLQGNGIVNQSMTPSHLQFFMTDDLSNNPKFKLSGNADLYAVIWAPTAEIDKSGNADLYGMLVGRDIDIEGNAVIHYDEALKEDENFRWLTKKGTRLTA